MDIGLLVVCCKALVEASPHQVVHLQLVARELYVVVDYLGVRRHGNSAIVPIDGDQYQVGGGYAANEVGPAGGGGVLSQKDVNIFMSSSTYVEQLVYIRWLLPSKFVSFRLYKSYCLSQAK